MRPCYINSSSEEPCVSPATKCILIRSRGVSFDDAVEAVEGKIWLCEDHYNDPDVRALIEALWDLEF